MVNDTIVERLSTLGVFPDTPENPNSVRENAEVFEKCADLDAMQQEGRKYNWSCSSQQFVFFHLEALLKRDQDYKARFLEDAKRYFGTSGIKPEHVVEYFQSGADPGLVFMMRHEDEYDRDTRLRFGRDADQFALDRMREWLYSAS